ncbi:MAG: hypothetical protein AAGI50_17565 [Pseudomonadota bacterium]
MAGVIEFIECDDPNAVKIDFEGFRSGTVIGDQFDGVSIRGAEDDRNDSSRDNDAMIFDSSAPTGGDRDLRTENQGNILIISEDDNGRDADDSAKGGSLTFDFESPARIFDLKVVDGEEGGLVILRDADGVVIGEVVIPGGVDNGIQQVILDIEGVSSMEVVLNGSGAIDDICYVPGEPPVETNVLCESFDDKSPETVVSSDFKIKNGEAVTNGSNDGELLFESVDLSELENVEVSFEACILSGSFEKTGKYADFLRVEFVTEGGEVIVLDTFAGDGKVLTGDMTGQTITASDQTLSYDLPEDLGEGQLRFVSDISAKSEKIKIDDVKIKGEEPKEDVFALENDLYTVMEGEVLEANIFDNDTAAEGATLTLFEIYSSVDNSLIASFDLAQSDTVEFELVSDNTAPEDDLAAKVTIDKDGNFTFQSEFGEYPNAFQNAQYFFLYGAEDTAGNVGQSLVSVNVLGVEETLPTTDMFEFV